MSWWDDGVDDDEPELDESSIRMRPNPKANRPRTKTRPEHLDALTARVLAVDRGRYTVLLDEGTPEERVLTSTRARELRKQAIVTGDPSSFAVYLFNPATGAQVAGGFRWTFEGV